MLRPTILLLAIALSAPTVLSGARTAAAAEEAPAKKKKLTKKQLKKLRKKAKRYEKKGKKAYKKGKWDDAVAAFELAHQVDPQPRYLFNIGRCLEKKGDLFKAMEYVQAYVDMVEDPAEKEDAAETHAILRTKLLRTSGELNLRTVPPSATVLITGEGAAKYTGKTPLVRWLPAGSWQIKLQLEAHQTQELELLVSVGDTLDKEVKLRSDAEIAVEKAKAEAERKKAEEEARKKEEAARKAAAGPEPAEGGPDRRAVVDDEAGGGAGWATWAALGVGGAALAGGVLVGLMAQSSNDELQGFKDVPGSATESEFHDTKETAETLNLTANVLYGVGIVGLAAGGAMLWMGGADAGAGWVIVPTADGAAGLWGGRF